MEKKLIARSSHVLPSMGSDKLRCSLEKDASFLREFTGLLFDFIKTSGLAAQIFFLTMGTLDAKPVIFNVSDAVTGGTSFSVNGSGFILPSMVVAVSFDTNGTAPPTPPLDTAYCSVLMTDKLSNFVIAQMPNVGTNGVFNLWMGNSTGWSAPIKLNAARPLFLSDYQTFSNETIEVVGRNFDQREFNGQGITMARLNDGVSVTTNVTILDYNPYHMTLLLSNQPVGTYYVEVSNDSGTNWSRTTSGQTLQVLSYPSGTFDPLGLGVEWAKDFNWGSVSNVTTYGVMPNATNDCTKAVQTILNNIENTGGGVAYFPSGCYYLSNVLIGADVVIEGSGITTTILLFDGTNSPSASGSWFKTKGTNSRGGTPLLQGIANMRLKLANETNLFMRPDIFLNLGDTSINNNDITVRTANRLFITGVAIRYPYNKGDSNASDSRRGSGFNFIGKERALIQNCNCSGWESDMLGTYLNNYCIVRGNSFEYSAGYTENSANYLFMETNTVVIHPEYNQDCHGLDGRANFYACGNYVNGAGDAANVNNDGEGIFNEATATGYFNYGKVASATSTALTVAPVMLLTNPLVQYGALSVYVTYGTGMGQMRPVTALDTNANVITVSPAFTVTPDASSIFTLYCPLANATYYANTVTNCAKGIWLYDNAFDSVAANNLSLNSDGIFLHSSRVGPPASNTVAQDRADAFVRICRNTVIGVSRRSHQGGIGISTGRFDSANFYDTTIYGAEIVSNSISGNALAIPIAGATETPPYSGIYLNTLYSLNNGIGTGDTQDTIIEGNTLNSLQFGMTVTTCNYGEYIDNNYCAPPPLVLNLMLINSQTAKPADNMIIAPQ